MGSYSGHLTDEQISALVDEEDNILSQHHIEECESCRKRYEDAIRLENVMRHGLHRIDCPSPQTLGNYNANLLNTDDNIAIEEHLKICTTCRSELEILQSFLDDFFPENDESETINSEKIIRPYEGFFEPKVQTTSMRKVRGNKRGNKKRQIRAETDEIVLLIDIQIGTSGLAIEGLVLPATEEIDLKWAGSLVEIRMNQELILISQVDDMETFRCEPVPEGMIDVRITSPTGNAIVLPDIEIEPSNF